MLGPWFSGWEGGNKYEVKYYQTNYLLFNFTFQLNPSSIILPDREMFVKLFAPDYVLCDGHDVF